MQRTLYLIFFSVSLLSLAAGFTLFVRHLLGANDGMILIFLMPLLIAGLLIGLGAAMFARRFPASATTWVWLNRIHMGLMLIGLGVLIATTRM